MAELPRPLSHTVSAIFAHHAAKVGNWDSIGISASALGNECDRALWYAHRWATEAEAIDGRRARLFQTGHREEERLVYELRAIGCEVLDTDPATGRQWKVHLVGGHLRGKLDGRVFGVPEAPRAEHVLECKTHNARSFKELEKKGVRAAKPAHFAQVQIYMDATGVHRSLYLAACKDDDALYAERIAYDPAFAIGLVARVERVVQSPRPPAKAYEDPTSKAAFACQWCPARPVCHEGAFARFSCRTCLHATPLVEASDAAPWHCAHHKRRLTVDEQRRGCAAHLYVPDLVPGEQVDCDPQRGVVVYRLGDGTIWTDGAGLGDAA